MEALKSVHQDDTSLCQSPSGAVVGAAAVSATGLVVEGDAGSVAALSCGSVVGGDVLADSDALSLSDPQARVDAASAINSSAVVGTGTWLWFMVSILRPIGCRDSGDPVSRSP